MNTGYPVPRAEPSARAEGSLRRPLHRHRSQLEDHRAEDPEDRRERRVAAAGQRLVQALSAQRGVTGDLAHALGTGHVADRCGDEGRIATLERRLEVAGDALRGVEVVGGVTTRLGRAAGKGHMVLESLYRRPIVSVQEVQAVTGTGYAAANNLVSDLVMVGILKEITGRRRHRRFRDDPYVRLFDGAPGEQEM